MTAPTDGDQPLSVRVRLGTARTLTRASGGVRDLAERADRSSSAAQRVAPHARRAARGLGSAAGYLREKQTDEIFEDLEDAVRRRPLTAMMVAFVAGYLTRRVL